MHSAELLRIAELAHRSSVLAMKELVTQTSLTVAQAKAYVLHFSSPGRRCHRCAYQLSEEGAVRCPRCTTANIVAPEDPVSEAPRISHGNWYLLCENPRAITQLFEAAPPDNPVEVLTMRFDRDGPVVRLHVELPTFPERPHPRWESGANTIVAQINFWGVTAFEQIGWGTNNIGTLKVEREELLRFSFVSSTARFSGLSMSASIGRVTALIDGEKPR